ncbi:MAG: hypothetical protein ORN53_05345 [Crocinitomicaceae bacterium]|nr:hypothetical protein [Crocinitomicaceae bacterium]
MESFTLKGGNGCYVKLILADIFDFPLEKSFWGGYEVKVNIEIKSGNFHVHSSFHTSTGELAQFYHSLKNANKLLSGKVQYRNFEQNTFINLSYDHSGHITINGSFSEENELNNQLDFEFQSDQSFIELGLTELQSIVSTYGGMTDMNEND